MDTVQQIAFFFSYSAQRRVFQAQLELDEDAQVGMNNINNLQSHCEKRWFNRANALHIFKCAFTAVVTALEYMEENGDGKAKC